MDYGYLSDESQEFFTPKLTKSARRHRSKKLAENLKKDQIRMAATRVQNRVFNSAEEVKVLLDRIPLAWQKKAEYKLVIKAFLPHLVKLAVRNAEDKINNTLLILILTSGHVEMATALFKEIPYSSSVLDSLLNATDTSGSTGLMHAVSVNAKNFIKKLPYGFLNSKQIDARNNEGLGAILLAAQFGHAEILNDLIVNHLKWRNPQEVLPVLTSLPLGNFGVQETFPPLLLAASKGHTAAVSVLLGHLYKDAKSSLGHYTAISLAAKNGHLETVEALMTYVKLSDDSQEKLATRMPLVMAAVNGHEKVVRILTNRFQLKRRSIDEADHLGYTALLYAVENEKIEVVKYLIICADANPCIKNYENNNALLLAAKQNNTELVNFLIRYCLSALNEKNESGYSALMYAAEKNNNAMRKALLDAGASDCEFDREPDSGYGFTDLQFDRKPDGGYDDIRTALSFDRESDKVLYDPKFSLESGQSSAKPVCFAFNQIDHSFDKKKGSHHKEKSTGVTAFKPREKK